MIAILGQNSPSYKLWFIQTLIQDIALTALFYVISGYAFTSLILNYAIRNLSSIYRSGWMMILFSLHGIIFTEVFVKVYKSKIDLAVLVGSIFVFLSFLAREKIVAKFQNELPVDH